jgi:diacylglycerol kinase (ATP)
MTGAVRHPAVALFNPAAAGGRAETKWQVVAPMIESSFDILRIDLDADGRWRDTIDSACKQGVRHYIAAGGDGTAGALVDWLVRMDRLCPLGSLTVGAVGLGSSNDLLKPFGTLFRGIPLRIGPATIDRDIGRARVVDENGREEERHFFVSASLGLTAEANAFFSRGDRLQHWLRKRWTEGAILYATCRTLALYENEPATIRGPEAVPSPCSMTNLTVAKSEWVSGRLSYGAAVAPDDGLLLVNLCEGMTRGQALRVLLDLVRSRFATGRGRHQWRAPGLTVSMPKATLIELDGEVLMGRQISFDTLPERIKFYC